MNEILKLAADFEKLAQMPFGGKETVPMGNAKTSMQPDDVEKALVDAGLWGGSEGSFDPNGKSADKIFRIIDKYAPPSGSFKIDAIINVPNNLNVTITAKALRHSADISRDLTRVFGPAMTAVLKKLSKTLAPPPDPGLAVKWLNQVGY